LQPARGNARFPRALRLTRAREFSRVFQRAVKSSDDCFTLLAAANQLGHPRLGLAVSRKHARRAVARNRIKRVVRESFRLHQHQLGPVDVVVLARPGLENKTTAQMHASLRRHWARLQQRCARS